MNRRSVLRGLAALPIATAFSGCYRDGDDEKRKHDNENPQNSKGSFGARKLRIILMGPFAVVQQKELDYRIKAYVPFDDENPKNRRHEFRFPSPSAVENKHDSYQFTLQADIVKRPGQPYVDSGFDGLHVEIPEWTPPSKAFVSLDLPAPNIISFLRPPEGVLFEPSDQYPQGQYATLPLNQVLEYTLKEGCTAKLVSKQLDHDATPLSCDDLHQQSIAYGKKYSIPESQYSRHNLLDQTLTDCSDPNTCTFFLGVGLSPDEVYRPENYKRNDQHALKFFNEKLLPSLYGSQERVPQGKRIVQLKVSPCSVPRGVMMPMLVPAVQRLPFPQPRYMPVASTENCTAPTVTATAARLGH